MAPRENDETPLWALPEALFSSFRMEDEKKRQAGEEGDRMLFLETLCKKKWNYFDSVGGRFG